MSRPCIRFFVWLFHFRMDGSISLKGFMALLRCGVEFDAALWASLLDGLVGTLARCVALGSVNEYVAMKWLVHWSLYCMTIKFTARIRHLGFVTIPETICCCRRTSSIIS